MNQMSRRISLVLVLAILTGAIVASANLISYTRWSANRNRIMVMEDTGANPVEIFTGGKFSPFGLQPSISPPRSDGTWVAFREGDVDIGVGSAIYKIKADGTGFTKVLCSGYDGENGVHYGSPSGPRWAPDDRWIAFQTHEGVALIPADFEVGLGALGQACAAPIQFIYLESEDPNWDLDSRVAWNHDGTQIALMEVFYPRDPENERIRVLVLVRDEANWTRLGDPVETNVEIFGKWPWSQDWERDGNLLLIHTIEGSGPQGVAWVNWIDIYTGDWGYVAEGASPSWSPDNSHLLIVNDRDEIVKWRYPDGPGEVLTKGENPDWQRDAQDQQCEFDTECDDLDPCTIDGCIGGECVYSPSYAECDDLNECTGPIDLCDEFFSCIGDPLPDGSLCPDGVCCGAQCVDPCANCDDGDDCTIDTCIDDPGYPCLPVCEHTADPACQCLTRGEICTSNDECCSGQCHPRKGTCK